MCKHTLCVNLISKTDFYIILIIQSILLIYSILYCILVNVFFIVKSIFFYSVSCVCVHACFLLKLKPCFHFLNKWVAAIEDTSSNTEVTAIKAVNHPESLITVSAHCWTADHSLLSSSWTHCMLHKHDQTTASLNEVLKPDINMRRPPLKQWAHFKKKEHKWK